MLARAIPLSFTFIVHFRVDECRIPGARRYQCVQQHDFLVIWRRYHRMLARACSRYSQLSLDFETPVSGHQLSFLTVHRDEQWSCTALQQLDHFQSLKPTPDYRYARKSDSSIIHFHRSFQRWWVPYSWRQTVSMRTTTRFSSYLTSLSSHARSCMLSLLATVFRFWNASI